jgi:hypothetical protein
MDEVKYAFRYLTPFLRLVPIWKYGACFDADGYYVGEGWYLDRYGMWVRSESE